MNARVETVHVHDTTGDLEVCRGGSDLVLLFDGHPCAIVWPASDDQAEHFFVRAFDTAEIAARVESSPLVRDGYNPSRGLVEQVRPLLQTMVDGRYRVELVAPLGSDDDVAPSGSDAPLRTARWLDWSGLHRVGSAEPLLLGSVPRERLDPARLNRAMRGIRQGRRPVLVLLTVPDVDVTFIVLGHEAMEACQRAGVAPLGLLITYETPRALGFEDGLRLLQDAYRRCADLASAHYASARGEAVIDRVS